jgi:signal transduction histidine kinase
MSRVNILAVDDTPQNLLALDALLARPGVRVLQARSADEALDWLLREPVALALIDVQMPHTDGFELAEMIRGSARTRHVPLIFLTATVRDPARTFRGYETGAVDFLHKPLDPAILRSKVAVFVELAQQREELARQLARLEEALRVNELFTAVLGHDLRSPLGAIVAAAEVLALTAHDSRSADAAALIRRAAGRMNRMIAQLLDVARIQGGQLALDARPVDVAALARAACDEVASAGDAQRILVEVDCDTIATVDPDRVSQILSNLIGNALQHGVPGMPVTVRVDGQASGSVRVQVRNAGRLPDSAHASLHRPFSSARPRIGSGGGNLGLGLHIVSYFVHAHGGTIEVDGDRDQTTFIVTLPRQLPPGADSIRDPLPG